MKRIKSTLTVLLAIIMIAGIIPSSAFAGEIDETEYYEQTEGSSQYDEEAAWQAQQEAESIAAEEAERQAAEQAAAMQEAMEAAAEEAAREAEQQAAEQQSEIDESYAYEEAYDMDETASIAENSDNRGREAGNTEDKTTAEDRPAQDFKETDLGDDAVLLVSVAEGVLPKDTKLEVTDVNREDADKYAAVIKEDAGDDYKSSRVFEIKFYNDGKEVTPAGKINLTFKNIKGDGESAVIYGINDSKANLLAGPLDISKGKSADFRKISTNNSIIAIVVLDGKEDTTTTTGANEDQTETTKTDKDNSDKDDNVTVKSFFDNVSELFKGITSSIDGLLEEVTASADAVTKDVIEHTDDAAENFEEQEEESSAEKYPAFSAVSTVEGGNIEVSVDAPEGAFPENVRLYAGIVETPEAVLNAIESDSGGEADAEEAVSVDVHFYLEGAPDEEVEPLVPVNVTFSNIEINSDTIDVYHEAEKIAEAGGDDISVEVGSFSVFTFVGTPNGTLSDPDGGYAAENIDITPDGNSHTQSMMLDESNIHAVDASPAPYNSISYSITSGEDDIISLTSGVYVEPKKIGTASMQAELVDNTGATVATLTFDVIVHSTLEYDLNGGTGDVPEGGDYTDTTQTEGVTAPDDTGLTPPVGYDTLLGWAEDPNETDPSKIYAPGDDLSELLNTPGGYTLYAIWDPITIDIDVLKSWDDDENRDGIRPDSVTVKLVADGEETGDELTLDETIEWKDTFKDVPAYKDGVEITYTVTEETDDVITGTDDVGTYSFEVTGDADEGFTITNTHTPETYKTIHVTKVWDDNDDEQGKRPTDIYARLYANGTYLGKQRALNDGNGWGASNPFTSTKARPLYVYENGEKIEYSVIESATISGDATDVEGYIASITGDAENGFEITNKIIPDTVNVTIEKIWDDDDDANGIRPGSVHVFLKNNGKTVANSWLREGTDWSVTFTDIARYDANGNEINYYVEEAEVRGYTAQIEKDDSDPENISFTVTNSHDPSEETLNVTVSKTWDDENNHDKARPESITYTLYANGAPVKTETLTGNKTAATWKDVVFEDLPVYEGGHKIAYSVIEGTVEGYVTQTDTTVDDDGNINVQIKNTRANDKTTVTVIKQWDDDNDRDGVRPESIDVVLQYRPVGGDSWYGYSGGTKTNISDANGWTASWIVNTVNNKGEALEWRVLERDTGTTNNVIKNYPTEDRKETKLGNNQFIITNVHKPETINVSLYKEWDDDSDRDGIRPDSVTMTVTGRIEVNAGSEDSYYKVVSEEDVTLTKTSADMEDGKWFKKLYNLPKYAEGAEIEYNVVENVPDGYTSDTDVAPVEPDDKGEAEVTFKNTHKPELVTIDVKKVWNDNDDQDGIRPDTLYIGVYANGTRVRQREISESSDWAVSIAAQTQYKYENGKEIEYTIKESVKRSGEPELPEKYSCEITGSVEDGFTITNTHKPQSRSITVKKIWDDNNNQDGLRPDYLDIGLSGMSTVPNYELMVVMENVRLSAENNWEYTFENLPYNFGGEYIAYSVEEDVPYGYTTVDSTSETKVGGEKAYINVFTLDSVVFINTHEPETANIVISKTWDDEDDSEGIREEAADGAMLTLFANGVAVREAEVPKEDGDVEFEGLPVYEGGSAIAYTVAESSINDYTTEIIAHPVAEEESESGEAVNVLRFDVKNTHTPGMRTITVVKNWDDDSDRDGLRPDDLSITLTGDDEDETEFAATLSEEDKWAHTFNVPVKAAGEEIKYSVKEDEVPSGYTASYSDVADENGILIITNKHKPATGTIDVIKTWDDDDDRDGIRPSSIQIVLKADGVAVEGTQTELSATGNWKKSFFNLPVYANGEKISYSVEETVPDGYVLEDKDVAGKVLNQDGTNRQTEFNLKNVHEPETFEVITATKYWDDDDDRDGLRDNITLNLAGYADAEEVVSATFTTTEVPQDGEQIMWHLDKDGNPLYKYYEGKEITYVVTEAAKPDGYETVVTGDTDSGFVVTNTHEPELIDVTVTKTWDDENDQDGVRPEMIDVTLTEEYGNYSGTVSTERVSASDNWEVTFKDLYAYEDGEPIVYKAQETLPDDAKDKYEQTGGQNESVSQESGTIALVNKHVPETLDITVNKTWDDDNNRDGLRPADKEATFTLLANGVAVDEAGVPAPDGNVVFSGLPMNANGQKIVYNVVESSIDNYTADIITHPAQPGEDNGKYTQSIDVTNSYAPGLKDVTVAKNWDDDNNRDGIRGNEVTVSLLADGEEATYIDGSDVEAVTLNEENGWVKTFKGVPIYNDGKEIAYTVEENSMRYEGSAITVNNGTITVEAGKIYTVSYENLGDEGGYITVTNKHIPATTDVTVTKNWVDGCDFDQLRPDSITLTLTANGIVVSGQLIRLSAENEKDSVNVWEAVIKDLPVYEDGEVIEYSVLEDVIDGYTTEIKSASADGNKPNITVTNTHIVELTNVTANKIWDDDDNRDGIRDDARKAFRLELKGYVNGEYIPFEDIKEYKDVHDVKYDGWAGDLEALANRMITALTGADQPKEISADDVVIWNDLPVYYHGTPIEYRVEEIISDSASGTQREAAEKYEASVEAVANNVFNVTNTHEPERFDLKIRKTWDDDDDRDGIRPDFINIDLIASGSKEEVVGHARLSAENNWEYVFEDLYGYEEGSAIGYTITEEEIKGYSAEVYNMNVSIDSESYIVDIVNTHVPETTDIIVNKTWDDEENQDGKRPEDGARIILLANGVAVGEGVFAGSESQETLSFENRPVREKGSEIVYRVIEDTIDDYTTEVKIHQMVADEESGKNVLTFDVTNKHEPGMRSIAVNKVWDDEDNIDGLRTDSVEIFLTASDETEYSHVLNAENGWTYTFNVPTHAKGEELEYVVKEDPVPEYYTASYTDLGNEGGYITVTNTHVPQKTKHTVTKVWDDNNNQDGVRPAYIQAYLMQDGERMYDEPAVLSDENGWTYTWTDLPAINYEKDAAEFEYSAEEVAPAENTGYKLASTETKDGTTTVTNSYTPKVMKVEGHKIWVDDNDRDGKRPESITVNLYADGDLVATQKVTKETAEDEDGNIWTYSFTDLPRYIEGHVVHYTVSEEAIPNYMLRVSGYDLYNTYTPGKTFATVIKLWDDNRDRDGIRPENIIVRLLANGEEVDRASLGGASSGWFTVFKDLDIYEDGKEIEYTVTEDAVDGYTSEISGDSKKGFTLTNKHEPEKTDVTIEKYWNDDNDANKKRPDSVTVSILLKGRTIGTQEIKASDGWKTTFEDVYKYSNGEEIEYEVYEKPVSSYIPSVTGYKITNIFKDVKDSNSTPSSSSKSSSGSGSSSSPKTGDKSPVALLIVILVLAALAITGMYTLRRRKI